jgi:hypothetical protein
VRRVVKTAVVAGAIGIPLLASWRYAAQFGDRAVRPPLYGVYEVDSFVRNGDTVLPLTTDESRWHRLIIGRPGSADVRFMDGSRRMFQTTVDGAAGHLTLVRRTDSTRRSTLAYVAAGDTLVLQGLLEGDTLHVRLHRLDVGGRTTGFRWIRE